LKESVARRSRGGLVAERMDGWMDGWMGSRSVFLEGRLCSTISWDEMRQDEMSEMDEW
jgi:hypothetical protein